MCGKSFDSAETLSSHQKFEERIITSSSSCMEKADTIRYSISHKNTKAISLFELFFDGVKGAS